MKRVCVNHPDTKATVLCAFCSKPICSHCVVEHDAHFYCSEECAENAGKAALEQAKADAQNYGIKFSEDYTVLEYFPKYGELTSYQIPACVTAIGDKAFSDCTSLNSIMLGNNIITIGNGAFVQTGRIVLDKGNQNFMIQDDALIEKQTQRLIHYWGRDENYHVPDDVTAIGDEAFSGCTSLKSITLPDSVTAIGDEAFSYCTSLKSVTLPDGVTAIGDEAFSDCTSLKSITLPDSVTAIGREAFSGCSSLKSITFGKNVAAIGKKAFVQAGRIVLDKGNQNFMIKDDALIEKQTQRLIHYFGQNENYHVPDDVAAIGEGAFKECTSLSRVC